MWVNSTPVTPEPITHRCSGISWGGYAWRVVRTRSPSTVAQSGMRGRDPVARTTKSASSSSIPDSVSATTSRGPCNRPLPWISRTPWDSRRDRTDAWRCASIDATRSRKAPTSRRPCAWRPIERARVSSESSPPVAIMAFDGMQSQRCAAPPMMSRSTSVTSAPRVAATVAAVFPPGPPPMITTRTAIGPGYVTARFANVLRMPELRHDAISGRSVIVAIERAARPFTFPKPPASTTEPGDCPFCAGREEMTPPEVHRTGPGEAETQGWRVRVVPNLYPIVGPAEPHDPPRTVDFGSEHGATAVAGAHEVVVLSPDHDAAFARLDDDAAIEVLAVIRDRVRFHLDAGHAYVQAFVNHGEAAGASIAHPHAQLVALDMVPPAVAASVDRLATSDLVARELADARRENLVVLDGPAPAWSPFAAWVPYGLRVAHRSTRARFDEATDAEIRVVALGLRDALARLLDTLGDVPYNVVLRTAPPDRVRRRIPLARRRPPAHDAGRRVRGRHRHPRERGPARAGRVEAARHERAVTIVLRLCETIGVAPDAVWAAMEDIESHTEWMTDAVAITFRTERHAGVGTEFECLTRVGPFSTTDVMTVTEWQPGVVMGIEHRGVVTGTGRFMLAARPGGLTELCWDEQLRFPWWMGGPAGEQLSRPVLARLWRANLARLRAKAETQAHPCPDPGPRLPGFWRHLPTHFVGK